MSQVMITCPRCKEKFKAEEAEIYECPFCGTSIRPKQDSSEDLEKTQQFQS